MEGIVELWKPVVGYEGLYEVSDQGRVRSCDRIIETSTGKRKYKGRLITAYPASKKRYSMIRLSWPYRKKFYVHYLVASAFLGPRPNGFECRHLDDNPVNNKVGNLAWGTKKENMADARRNGTLAVGDKCKWQHRTRNNLGQFQ